MLKLDKAKAVKQLQSASTRTMSVCSSCASCGCGGSRCVSTCKGCHDKDVEVTSVAEVYAAT